MPNFKSPISNKQFAGQPMMEFDVPDETDQYPEMTPIMRQRGPGPHGPQPPVDMEAAIAFQNRLSNESIEDTMEFERQVKEAKEARRLGKERLNGGAKRRIEMLVGMTRDRRDVNLNGNVYVLQTLKSKELRESIMAASEFDGTVQFPFELRRQILGRSLIQVAGVDIEQFVGSNSVEAKLQLIDDLPEPLSHRLYTEYNILVTEAQDRYAIRTVEDAQEVADDLKK